ncbi:hypothetical protein CDD83_8511 [Cordyceps sp. RAO-2017]|nr:hypothetical protein CDD83_8511 [Cordyceps sp. RAO-2017]
MRRWRASSGLVFCAERATGGWVAGIGRWAVTETSRDVEPDFSLCFVSPLPSLSTSLSLSLFFSPSVLFSPFLFSCFSAACSPSSLHGYQLSSSADSLFSNQIDRPAGNVVDRARPPSEGAGRTKDIDRCFDRLLHLIPSSPFACSSHRLYPASRPSLAQPYRPREKANASPSCTKRLRFAYQGPHSHTAEASVYGPSAHGAVAPSPTRQRTLDRSGRLRLLPPSAMSTAQCLAAFLYIQGRPVPHLDIYVGYAAPGDGPISSSAQTLEVGAADGEPNHPRRGRAKAASFSGKDDGTPEARLWIHDCGFLSLPASASAGSDLRGG